MDELPHNPNGKTDRRKLGELMEIKKDTGIQE